MVLVMVASGSPNNFLRDGDWELGDAGAAEFLDEPCIAAVVPEIEVHVDFGRVTIAIHIWTRRAYHENGLWSAGRRDDWRYLLVVQYRGRRVGELTIEDVDR
jgi:hypothetical protein